MKSPVWSKTILACGALGILVITGCGPRPIANADDLHSSESEPTALETVSSTGTATADSRPAKNSDDTQAALSDSRDLLQQGLRKLADREGYAATFFKQEEVSGELLPEEVIDLKVRQNPFSIYMDWRDSNQEIAYIDGQNDNKVAVRPTGLKGVFGAVQLDPDSNLIMQSSRYPITTVGLAELSRRLIEYRQRDLTRGVGVVCSKEADQQCGERDCFQYVLSYASPAVDPDYSRSIVLIDKQSLLPVCVTNYGWPVPADDSSAGEPEAGLIEHYAYKDLRFDVKLTDDDFQIQSRKVARQ